MGVKQIYMVIGCPASGKSWVCDQLKDRFHYVRHDDFIGANYVGEIARQARTATKPLLIETPFSVSQIKDPLEQQGFNVVPVIIQEQPEVLCHRYRERGSGELPIGHLSRQDTYVKRAIAWNAYRGTSAMVLAYLKNAAPEKERFPWE